VNDPANDDLGPGSYTYPSDVVFPAQAYDLKSFSVALDDKNLVFKFSFNGPIPNPWGSGNNLAIQTLDVYVDKDPGAGTGARLLLPGRNASLEEGNGWDYAVWAEGWTPQFIAPDAKTLEPKQVIGVDFKIIVDPANRTVTLRVPRSAFGEGDPTQWGYVAAVLGQEGYPATGVWRVRDVNTSSEQWRFGGAPDDTNHTRIIDLAWPDSETPTQEDMLSEYRSSTADPGTLTADDYAQIKILLAK
jgi:carbohydrate-binding DOMON domain-containing protein